MSVFNLNLRLGFRTERIQPFNLKDGVTLRRRLPLDGPTGHAQLEVRANLCLPEPEVRSSLNYTALEQWYWLSVEGYWSSLLSMAGAD